MTELVPTGKLRFGVVSAPEQTSFFVVKDATGTLRGVTVDLARELARGVGVPIEFMVAPNSGEITDALSSGAIDAAFMPVDDERKKRVEFGPAYALAQNTYLVRAGSDIRTIAEVDRPGIRVIGVAGTTTIRTSGRLLKNTTIAPVRGVEDAMAMIGAGFSVMDHLIQIAGGGRGGRAVHGGLDRPFRAGGGDEPDPPRDAGLVGGLPQPGPPGQDRRRGRSRQSRAAHARNRRGLA